MDTTKISKKQQAGNALPIIIILGLIIGAGYFLIGEDIRLPKFLNGEPKFDRVEGFPKTVYVTKEMEKRREVITSEEELNKFLNEVDENNQIDFKGKINFDRKMLIAVASAYSQTDGNKFKIRRAYKDDEKKTLLIALESQELGELCEKKVDPNIIVDFATIDKTDWKIDFEVLKKINEDCE
ncbi:MAG: hypothetical protein WC243_04140 [Patescibacteria group bacterium]|jgi:hypothetical protein